jgi:hypothetical protein
MSFSGLLLILYLFSVPKNRNDILNSMQNHVLSTILLFLTVVMTLILTYYAVRLRARKFSRATTTIEHSEV